MQALVLLKHSEQATSAKVSWLVWVHLVVLIWQAGLWLLVPLVLVALVRLVPVLAHTLDLLRLWLLKPLQIKLRLKRLG